MEKEEQSGSYEKTVKLCGIDEAQTRDSLAGLLDSQEKLRFDFSTVPGEVHVRVSAEAKTAETARALVKSAVREMKIRLGSYIFATKAGVTLEQTVVDLLKEQKLTVTTVESCTGGMVSARLTNVAGVSEVFRQGYITYSNKAKRRMVGVKKSTLKKYTAVSSQTAWEMARGGAVFGGSDVCVSVTGYAGPDGGENGEPAGLVYIGCNVSGNVKVEEFHFEGDRQAVREQAAAQALVLLRSCLLENYQI